MDVVLVDKLFLQDHLHGSDDLSHDDQKVSCGTGESRGVFRHFLVRSSMKCTVDLRLRLKLQVCFLFQSVTEDPSTK